jgi:type II secretory pathway component PulF
LIGMNEPDFTPEPALSAAAAQAVVAQAAQIAATGMPLPAGLRAAATECDSWRVARGMRRIAAEMEQGRSLDECLQAATRQLPPHLTGLVRAAQRTGAIGPMLAEWLENRRVAREQWRAIVAALAYPTLAVLLAVGVYVLFATVIVSPFKQMYEEFGLKLPPMTTQFLRSCEVAVPMLVLLVGSALATAVAARVFGGRAGWSWLLTNLPLVGNAWHWTGVAETLRCLSLLVQHRVPLPEAMRLAADGATDAYVGNQCRHLADSVEQGTSLTMALVQRHTLPVSIVPLVRWGEQHDALSAALLSAAEMIEQRLEMRANLLVQIIPPIVFVVVGGTVSFGAIALFLPMISLIQGLT